MKYKKGDTIIVTVGKDKGRKGKIEKVLPDKQAVIVAKINSFKRHLKKRDDKNPGGIIDIIRPIDVAKIAIVCPSCNRATRLGFMDNKGEKIRICRKCEHKI